MEIDKAQANAEGMLIAWWAARGPDRMALYTNFGDRSYEELNTNINRLVRAFRGPGPGGRRQRGHHVHQPARVPRDAVGGPAGRSPADADQLAPHR